MSATCAEAAEALTRELGFNCNDVAPVVSFRNPADLVSWTQPVLELLIIGGAIFALVHAIRRLRQGDRTNIALWFGSLAYLAIVEPPLYFPEWFGLDEIYGFIFAHNEFTVQFMYDRLPLYIIAIYPALTALAYETVRAFGVFARRGPLVGAICVGFVSQVFYEIFDHLGPPLKWWAWNQDNDIVNHPMFDSVPMTSMVLFASVSIGFLTYLVVKLVGGDEPRSGWSVAGRAVLVGVLTPLGMVVAGLPSSIFGGDSPNVTAQAWALGIELALIWLVGGWFLFRSAVTEPPNRFVAVFPAAFLGVHAVLWLSAAPGSLNWYVIACFVAGAAMLVRLYRRPRTSVG